MFQVNAFNLWHISSTTVKKRKIQIILTVNIVNIVELSPRNFLYTKNFSQSWKEKKKKQRSKSEHPIDNPLK